MEEIAAARYSLAEEAELKLRYDDAKNRLAGYDVTVSGTTGSIDYVYGEAYNAPDVLTSVKLNGSNMLTYGYDALNRLSRRTLSSTATPYVTTYSYLQGANAKQTTALVSTLTNGSDSYSYTYDQWGKTISTTGTLANTIGTINPIRYRGYYYDVETGFYYVNSR